MIQLDSIRAHEVIVEHIWGGIQRLRLLLVVCHRHLTIFKESHIQMLDEWVIPSEHLRWIYLVWREHTEAFEGAP
jgi:hypothetical protein